MTATQSPKTQNRKGSTPQASDHLSNGPELYDEMRPLAPNEDMPLMESPSGDSSDSDHNGGSSASTRPRGWTSSTFVALKKVVAQARGAASKPVVDFIQKYLKGTKLIFVLGGTGNGKSTLLKEISGQEVHVGHTHKSGTKNYQIWPTMIDDEQYLFVDTAGFGAADMDDMKNLQDIITCLNTLGPFVTFTGVLFLISGNQDRMRAEDLKTLQWLKCFCGPDFYSRITIAITKWDTFSKRSFRTAWNDKIPGLLKDSYFEEILERSSVGSQRFDGARVYYHGLVLDPLDPLKNMPAEIYDAVDDKAQRAELARRMIRHNYRETSTAKLQIAREMESGITWCNTEAAKVLKGSKVELRLDEKTGFIRVSTSATPTATRPDPQPVDTTPEESSPSVPQNAPKASPKKPQAASKKEPDSTPSGSAGLFKWLEVALDVAMFFFYKKKGRKGGESKKAPDATFWSDPWGHFGSWWSGTPQSNSWDLPRLDSI